MLKARVLLDSNILVSGLVFTKGNEHQILRMVEEGRIRLVMPESVLIEVKSVLAEKFPGFEVMLDIFLRRIEFEVIALNRLFPMLETYERLVTDKKDTLFYAAVTLVKPEYVVTGDKALARDLRRSSRITKATKVCSTKELLQQLRKRQAGNSES